VGARTEAKLLPAEELAIVVLTNAFPSGVPEAITSAFFDLVLQGRITRDWLTLWQGAFAGVQDALGAIGAPYASPPAQPSPALPASAYTGTYANDYLGTVEIVEREGGLVLLIGPQQRPYPLQHFDRDVFTQQAYSEPPAPRSGVTFSVGPDGTAQSVVLEYFNDAGQGTLTRVPAKP
jgi:hypothetical protein